MPTPGMPVYSEHLTFAVVLFGEFIRVHPNVAHAVAREHAVHTAKELILAARAWKRTRCTAGTRREEDAIWTRIQDLSDRFGLSVTTIAVDDGLYPALSPRSMTPIYAIPQ